MFATAADIVTTGRVANGNRVRKLEDHARDAATGIGRAGPGDCRHPAIAAGRTGRADADRHRIVGTELQPQWREAIELATQRRVRWMQDKPALLYFVESAVVGFHSLHARAFRHGVPRHVQHP